MISSITSYTVLFLCFYTCLIICLSRSLSLSRTLRLLGAASEKTDIMSMKSSKLKLQSCSEENTASEMRGDEEKDQRDEEEGYVEGNEDEGCQGMRMIGERGWR